MYLLCVSVHRPVVGHVFVFLSVASVRVCVFTIYWRIIGRCVCRFLPLVWAPRSHSPQRHCQPATSPSQRSLIWWSMNTWRIDGSREWKYHFIAPHLIPSFITHDLIIDDSRNSVSDVLWTGWKWVCNPLARCCSFWELSQWQKIITVIMTKSVTTLRSVPLHNVNISAPELSPALCSALWRIQPHPAFMFHSPETLN